MNDNLLIGGDYMLRSILQAQLDVKLDQMKQLQKEYDRTQRLIGDMLTISNRISGDIDDLAADISDLKDEIGGLE